MISISVIGTTIVNKVASLLPKDKFSIKNNFLSISPLSFVRDDCPEKIDINSINSEAYPSDINRSVFVELKSCKSDAVIIDLLDCRLDLIKAVIDGHDYTVSGNNGVKKFVELRNGTFSRVYRAFDVPLEKWAQVFTVYAQKLRKIYSAKKIIVLEAKNASFVITKNKHLFHLLGNELSNEFSLFYERIYTVFKMVAPEFIYIPFPSVWYCDGAEHDAFDFYLSQTYYDYAANAVQAAFEGNTDNIKSLCMECTKKLLANINMVDPRIKKWHDVELHNFCGIYDDDFNNHINTNGAYLDIVLRGPNNRICVEKNGVISNCKIILAENNDITVAKGVVLSNVEITLINKNRVFVGGGTRISSTKISLKNTSDIFIGSNNNIYDETKFSLGNGVEVKIGDENIIWGLKFLCLDRSKVNIGSKNKIMTEIGEIRAHDDTTVRVGNETLWSQRVQLLVGDGHSIFDVITGKKTNSMAALPAEKASVVINNHVWIGLGAMLLAGTDIGEGSIVGANAVVKKKFSNNVVLAGNPAKVVRNSIAWSDNNAAIDIVSCGEYIKNTIEQS